MSTTSCRRPLMMLLVMAATLCGLLPLPVFGATTATAVLITEPLLRRGVFSQGELFYSTELVIDYAGGAVMLAQNDDGTGSVFVDDLMIMRVTRPDGSQEMINERYAVGCSYVGSHGPRDISSYLRQGRNSIRFEMYDLCGDVVESSRLALNGAIAEPVDSDGDGLLDDWEIFGLDVDQDGKVDVNLRELGARKDHKDVFVYVDWLEDPIEEGKLVDTGHSHRWSDNTLDGVVAAFHNAPVPKEEGGPGIDLHIIWGNPVTENSETFELGSIDSSCQYDWSDFDKIKQASFPKRYWPVFHYALIAHDLPKKPCDGERPSGISRNYNSYLQGGASDFIVAMTGLEGFYISFGINGVRNARAGTFMHELGHNLGLGHGGVTLDTNGNVVGIDDTLRKPNHLSVMNESLQNRGLRRQGLFGLYWDGNLDYSVFDSQQLATIKEGAIDETTPLGSSDVLKSYGTSYFCPDGNKRTADNLTSRINWNCDSDTDDGADGGLKLDVNKDSAYTELVSMNEWRHLRFDGGNVGGYGAGGLPATTSLVALDELTIEEDMAMGPAAPAPPQVYLPLLAR